MNGPIATPDKPGIKHSAYSKDLEQVLRQCTRPLFKAWREMGMTEDPKDPIAQELLMNRSLPQLKAIIDGVVDTHKLPGFRPYTGGNFSVVLDAGDYVLRLGHGGLADHSACPHMLQAIYSGT
jgi:hypothetical protein